MRAAGEEPYADAIARLWVQGIVAGRLMGLEGFRILGSTLGPDGAYLPWFDVKLSGGAVVRVSFETMLTTLEPNTAGHERCEPGEACR